MISACKQNAPSRNPDSIEQGTVKSAVEQDNCNLECPGPAIDLPEDVLKPLSPKRTDSIVERESLLQEKLSFAQISDSPETASNWEKERNIVTAISKVRPSAMSSNPRTTGSTRKFKVNPFALSKKRKI